MSDNSANVKARRAVSAAGGSGSSSGARKGAEQAPAKQGGRVLAPPPAGALAPRALGHPADDGDDDGSSGRSARASGDDSAQTMSEVLRAMEKMQQTMQQQQQQIAQLTAARSRGEEEDDGRSSTSGPSSSGGSLQRARIERKQLAVALPAVLAYDKASNSGALEDWIDGMELLFHQLDVDGDEARLAEIRVFGDRDVRRWWEGQQQQALDEGAPIDTWEGFLQVLRAQFLPQLEAHEAVNELINIRQQAGEGMEKYFLRATRLFARTRGGFPDRAAMLIVLDRARKDEWRHALAVATREVNAEKITTLSQLRACLQREALAEPGKQRASGSNHGNGASSSSTFQRKPYAGAARKETVRAAAAAVPTEDSGSDGESAAGAPGGASSTKVAPTQQRDSARGGDRCARCKQTGHRAASCPKPDKRMCYVCGEVGHISATCPKRAADADGAQRKNE